MFLNSFYTSEFLSARGVTGGEFQAIGACDEKARERAAVECIVDIGVYD